MSDVLGHLNRVPWLAGFTAAELGRLSSGCVRRTLRRGQVLFEEGRSYDRLILVLAGHLQLHRRAGARQLRLRDVNPGQHLGVSLVAGALAGVTAKAGEADTVVLLIPGPELRELLARRPQAALAAIGELGRLVELLTEELVEARTASLSDRLLRHLVRLAGARREVAVTQQALADAIGASRERVNGALGTLEAAGRVRRHRGRVEVRG
ncbi:MAG: Crp/Fnr family transcriptional regulator [Myxococcaceae bacterium]|nr:Crp/Fnr family transcriptional regulator [Myxococcaceae bacterium]